MKKFINIFLAVLITLFSFPINSLNVNAEGKVYDDIEDGTYEIGVSSSSSAANGFLSDKAVLIVDGEDLKLIVSYGVEGYELNWTKLEGKDPIEEVEKDGVKHYTFKIDAVKLKYDKKMEYAVPDFPPMADGHEVDYDIKLDEAQLENLPKVEEKEEEPTPEEPENPEEDDKGESEDTESGEGDGSDENETEIPVDESEDEQNNGSADENEVDSKELAYAVDVPTMERYMEFVYLVEDGGKNQVTFRFNSQEFIDNFEIIVSDEYVETEDVVVEGDFVDYTFEITDLSKTLATKITIDAMGREMVHEFNVDFVDYKVAKELTYVVDVPTMERYMESVNLVEVGGKNQVTFRFNSQEFIDNFEIIKSGEYIETEDVVVEGDFVDYTFEITDLSKTLATKITIDAMGREMVHEFNVDFVDYKIKKEVIEAVSGEEKQVSGNQKLEVSNSKNDKKITIETPQNLPDNTNVKVEIKDEEDDEVQIAKQNNLKVAGAIVDVDLELDGELSDEEKFILTLPFDSGKYDEDNYDIDIYYFNGSEWVPQKGTVSDGEVSLEVAGFSMYGVFAVEKSEEVEDPKDEEKSDELKVSEIMYEVKHETEDKSSSANGFFDKPGYILTQDGETYFQTYITSWQMIDSLKYEGKDVEVVNVESTSKGDVALVQMKIGSDLSKAIALNMHITVPGLYSQEHAARLVFDVSSEEPIDSDGFAIYKGQGSGGQGGTPPTPTPEKPGGGKGTTDDKKPKKEKTDKVKADKVSTIDYVVYQADKNEVSAADSFFKKPAILLEKDGETYLQFTITSWSMVNWLKANGKDVLVIAEDKGKDTATVQIKIDGDLSEYITLGMKITVPGLYEMEHDARLALYPSSIVELEGEEAEGYFIHTGVAKPGDFGTNGDKKDKKKQAGENGNPQTGDTSQIFFFTMLLIGSLGVLVVQLRRRLVA